MGLRPLTSKANTMKILVSISAAPSASSIRSKVNATTPDKLSKILSKYDPYANEDEDNQALLLQAAKDNGIVLPKRFLDFGWGSTMGATDGLYVLPSNKKMLVLLDRPTKKECFDTFNLDHAYKYLVYVDNMKDDGYWAGSASVVEVHGFNDYKSALSKFNQLIAK